MRLCFFPPVLAVIAVFSSVLIAAINGRVEATDKGLASSAISVPLTMHFVSPNNEDLYTATASSSYVSAVIPDRMQNVMIKNNPKQPLSMTSNVEVQESEEPVLSLEEKFMVCLRSVGQFILRHIPDICKAMTSAATGASISLLISSIAGPILTPALSAGGSFVVGATTYILVQKIMAWADVKRAEIHMNEIEVAEKGWPIDPMSQMMIEKALYILNLIKQRAVDLFYEIKKGAQNVEGILIGEKMEWTATTSPSLDSSLNGKF